MIEELQLSKTFWKDTNPIINGRSGKDLEYLI